MRLESTIESIRDYLKEDRTFTNLRLGTRWPSRVELRSRSQCAAAASPAAPARSPVVASRRSRHCSRRGRVTLRSRFNVLPTSVGRFSGVPIGRFWVSPEEQRRHRKPRDAHQLISRFRWQPYAEYRVAQAWERARLPLPGHAERP